MTYRLLKRAVDDLGSIEQYLLQEFGVSVAQETRDRLFHTFTLLALHPGMGHSRLDVTARPVRFFSSSPYWIVYAPDVPITIHRVYHGRRDLARL